MGIWPKVARATVKKIDLSTVDPIVSFTFDDAPLSAFTNGGEILDKYGYRGTYYISGSLLGRPSAVGHVPDLDMIRGFHEKGHEIGNHTYDHLDCSKAGFLKILGNIHHNRRLFAEEMTGSFAYPYGAVNARARVATRLCATSARGISSGINRDIIDLMNLKAVRIYGHHGVDGCLDLIEECSEEGGWLIFYTHDVCHEPSDFGCTPEQLTRVVSLVNASNLTVTTIGEALRLIERINRE